MWYEVQKKSGRTWETYYSIYDNGQIDDAHLEALYWLEVSRNLYFSEQWRCIRLEEIEPPGRLLVQQLIDLEGWRTVKSFEADHEGHLAASDLFNQLMDEAAPRGRDGIDGYRITTS